MSTNYVYNGVGVTTASGTGSYTIPVTSAVGSTGSYLTSNGTWGAGVGSITVNSASSMPSLQVTGTAEFENDIKVKGKSILEALEKIEQRLAILVPDPKKLEQYEALQKAYKNYKMLEALCEVKEDESR